jgi:hypothetical protein
VLERDESSARPEPVDRGCRRSLPMPSSCQGRCSRPGRGRTASGAGSPRNWNGTRKGTAAPQLGLPAPPRYKDAPAQWTGYHSPGLTFPPALPRRRRRRPR